MIGAILFIMAAAMTAALFCLWIMSWSKGLFYNANLKLITELCVTMFLIAIGLLLPMLCIKHWNIFSDDKLARLVFLFITFGMGYCFFIAGAGLALMIFMEVIDDFRWAFKKKMHDKK